MSDRFFLDTNILAYSFDRAAPRKRQIAQELVSRALESGSGVVSWQVVQEFMNLALRKFSRPMSTEDGKLYLDSVLLPLCDVLPSPRVLHLALDVQAETRFGWYDALIVASAIEGQCRTLLSEDLQHGREVRGVRIEDPFRVVG